MKSNNLELLETDELIQKLIKNGFGNLVDILLNDEKKVYTKKGRLNKSGACRALGYKAKQLEDILASCREVLKDELD